MIRKNIGANVFLNIKKKENTYYCQQSRSKFCWTESFAQEKNQNFGQETENQTEVLMLCTLSHLKH